jgi:hypothetical protein
MDALIGVGFGEAGLSKDGEVVWEEAPDMGCYEDYMTVAQAESIASADPDHDWRIHFYGPLSEGYYQRQGTENWVLYSQGRGFA